MIAFPQDSVIELPRNTHRTTTSWTNDAYGKPYINATVTTYDQGQSYSATKRVEQVQDAWGNLTSMTLYNFGTQPGSGNWGGARRVYTNTYLATPAYVAAYMRNRLVTSTYSEYGASAMTLAQNEYDNYSPGCASGAGSCVITATPAGSVRQRDAAYTTSTTLRGNVTSTYRFGDGTSWLFYNDTGIVVKSKDPRGTIGTAAPDSSKNYAVPSSVTVAGLSSSMSWNDALGLTSASGPNGDTSSTAYGTSTFIGRPSGKTLPTGLTVSYAYTQNTTTETVNATPTARWTRTTTDGFGRPIKVETGTGATTTTPVSVVDTEYEPCACTPIGKMKRTTRPHAQGGTQYWTTYAYDALGRTVSVVAPDGSTTSYTYEGASVKVTDAKSKWKKYVKDAVGNLVTVWEPNPGGGTDLESTYLYNELDQLTSVTKLRGTTNQVRTFAYGSFGMTSKTEPETGTTTFAYRADGRLNYKLDAKGQKTESIYEDDIIPGYAQKRVKEIRKYASNGVQDTCQTVEMYYDGEAPPGGDVVSTAGTSGRLSGVRYFGRSIGSGQCAQTYVEQYTYLNYGAMTSKRLKVIRGTASGVLETVAEYDGEGRLKSVTYPATNRKVQYAFNDRGLPSGLTDVNAGTSIVSNVTYGVAGELLTIGGESRTYNINGQLTQLNLPGRVIQYNYTAGQNNGKIDSMVDSGETVVYAYDSLQRLISASGSTGWTQGYAYDLYGNLTSKTGLNGGSIGVDPTTNRMAGGSYDANGNQTAVPLIAGSDMTEALSSLSYDIGNRLVVAESAPGTSRRAEYDYDPGNKRIWEKRTQFGAPQGEWVYFFGITGQRMGRYTLSTSGAVITFSQEQASVWFGGKLVEKVDNFGAKTYPSEDRLGSVGKYLPYGESKPGASGNPLADNEKFATYTRDAGTGLDYADQRWHVPGAGRFLTADPNDGQVSLSDPTTLDRYSYSLGEPVSMFDPTGLGPIAITSCTAAQQEVSRIGGSVTINCGPLPPNVNPNGTGSTCLGQSVIPNPMCGLIPVVTQVLGGGPPPPKPGGPSCEELMTGLLIGYLAAHRSPLSADIYKLVSEGAERNIDPRVFVAIANAESTLFTAPNAIKANNPFGIMRRNGGGFVLATFSSVSAAIDALGETLTSQIGRGNDSIGELYSGLTGAYCYGSCAQGLSNATSAMTQMGGNPSSFSLPSQIGGVACEWRSRQ